VTGGFRYLASMSLQGWSTLVVRTAAATPPDRDRAVDALRALAIVGVLLGHWLVTALVLDPDGVRTVSPLVDMSYLVPASWVLQTLGLFFFVGGYANALSLSRARKRGEDYETWLRVRSARLGKPVLALLAVWVPVWFMLTGLAVPDETVHTLVKLAVSPLWFIGVYYVLTAMTPLGAYPGRALGSGGGAAAATGGGVHGPGPHPRLAGSAGRHQLDQPGGRLAGAV
jgi:peptidoglycan/LPS O-acetylase OafA/YrhL